MRAATPQPRRDGAGKRGLGRAACVVLGGGGIRMSGNDVVVHAKVWNKVVFVPWISIFLKLVLGGGLGLAFNRVAGWD